MSSDEKKYSLDELPDAGSSSIKGLESNSDATSTRSIKRPAPIITSTPRKEAIRLTKDDARIKVMEQSWRFDKKEFLFGWVPFVLIILVMQYLANGPHFREEFQRLEENLDGLGPLAGIIKNPLIFIFLTPVLFNFRKESGAWFEILFDGISTVKKIHLGPQEFSTRILVRWDEIAHVARTNSNDMDILVLSSNEGKMAELLWTITLEEKKGVQHLLKSFVTPAHPLRKFLEKDLA